MGRVRVLIMGSAGRDFHNFTVAFRQNSRYEVVAFTVARIPNIAGRTMILALTAGCAQARRSVDIT
jgi:predicted GTPase